MGGDWEFNDDDLPEFQSVKDGERVSFNLKLTFNTGDIEEEIINKAGDLVARRLLNSEKSSFASRINGLIHEKLVTMINEVMHKDMVVVDRWGKPTDEPKKFEDMVAEQMTRTLTQRVNSSGQPSTSDYDRAGTFAEYLMRSVLSNELKKVVDAEAKKLMVDAKEQLAKQMADSIVAAVKK